MCVAAGSLESAGDRFLAATIFPPAKGPVAKRIATNAYGHMGRYSGCTGYIFAFSVYFWDRRDCALGRLRFFLPKERRTGRDRCHRIRSPILPQIRRVEPCVATRRSCRLGKRFDENCCAHRGSFQANRYLIEIGRLRIGLGSPFQAHSEKVTSY